MGKPTASSDRSAPAGPFGLRQRLYRQLEPTAWPTPGLSPANKLVAGLILLSVFVAVLESEPVFAEGRQWLSRLVETLFAAVFAVEYLARVWVSVDNPRYGLGWRGRMRYMRSPAAALDLFALSPLLVPAVGGEAYLLRLFRLLRVLRLARLGRFSGAIAAVLEAVTARRYELWMSAAIAALLLLVSSTLLYLVEGGGQPEQFGSIPRAMWWSIATLTTVGYGDVYPATVLGKILAGLTAVTGIGLIAMPTGILAAAFSDAFQRRKRANGEGGEHAD